MPTPVELCRTWHREGMVPREAPELLRRTDLSRVNDTDAGTGWTPLHYSCSLREPALIQTLLDTPGVQVSQPDRRGVIPLGVLLSALTSQSRDRVLFPRLVSLALQMARYPGAEAVDTEGSSPLSLALSLCSSLGFLYTERRLLEEAAGSVPAGEEIPIRTDTSRTAAMICVLLRNPGLLSRVLEYRAPPPNLHYTDRNGMTALHIAGKLGDWDSGEKIVRIDPSVCRVKDDNGNTALFYFVVTLPPRKCLNMINTTSQMWDFDAVNNMGEDVLVYYDAYSSSKPREERKRIRDELWTHGTTTGNKRPVKCPRSPGFDSVIKESLEPIKPRKRGSVPEADDIKKSLQPLHLCLEDMRKVAELVTVLCENSDSKTMNQQDRKGYTPIMLCAKYGLQDEAEAMILARPGPNINRKNDHGDTALHLAARSGKIGITYSLLKHPDVRINEQDNQGNTPLFYILERFPRNESINLIAQFPWAFNVTNNQLELPGDYYASAASRSNPQRYAKQSRADEKSEKDLLDKLYRWRSIHEDVRYRIVSLHMCDEAPRVRQREPDENSEESDPWRKSDSSESGVSRGSRSSSDSTGKTASSDSAVDEEETKVFKLQSIA